MCGVCSHRSNLEAGYHGLVNGAEIYLNSGEVNILTRNIINSGE